MYKDNHKASSNYQNNYLDEFIISFSFMTNPKKSILLNALLGSVQHMSDTKKINLEIERLHFYCDIFNLFNLKRFI